MPRTLILGSSGYVGRCFVAALQDRGYDVIRATRTASPESDVVTATRDQLDDVIARANPDQIVSTLQLRDPGALPVIDRVDGSRWLVLSSMQLASNVEAPGTECARVAERLALTRGAVVIRPTMIFGHGGDLNISTIVRKLLRYRLALQVGGGQLLQPIHVDDLAEFAALHARDHQDWRQLSAPIELGGSEQIAVVELLDDLCQLAGVRAPRVKVSGSLVQSASRLAPVLSLRPDQVLRLLDDKVADNSVAESLGWYPEPTAQRLEQAVGEASALLMTSRDPGIGVGPRARN